MRRAGPSNEFASEGHYSRHSHGLEQFCAQMEAQAGLAILDLAGINQSNVGFITSLGHRLYSEDFLRSVTAAFGGEAGEGVELSRQRVDEFFRQSLEFPDHFLDAVFLWDVLEFLPPPLLKESVDRLFHVVKPGCCLLAFFHAEEKMAEVPAFSFRIADARTLWLVPSGRRRPAQIFNNRGIERLFHQFQSVKFFLARDHLREVIVTR